MRLVRMKVKSVGLVINPSLSKSALSTFFFNITNGLMTLAPTNKYFTIFVSRIWIAAEFKTSQTSLEIPQSKSCSENQMTLWLTMRQWEIRQDS